MILLKHVIFIFALLSASLTASAATLWQRGATYYATPQAACQPAIDSTIATSPSSYSLPSDVKFVNSGRYDCGVTNLLGDFSYIASVYSFGGDCSLITDSTYTDNGSGVCVQDDPCVSTEGQSVSWLSATGTDGCVDGCTTGGVTACFNIPKIVNGVTTAEYHCSSDYSSTGTSCTGGGDTQTQPLIETCASGQIAGDFNGSLQCVDSTTGQIVDTSPDATQTTTSNTTSSTVDNGDGTSTKTDTTTTTNPNGSTNTSTTTTNYDSGGNVTSSSTVNNFTGKDSNGDGTPDGTGEGDGEGEDTESTYSASACGTAPACEGDAIQCAIATQQHEANCLITGDGSPITTESLLGAGEATTLEVDPSDQYDISGMLDTSSFVAGACPAPRTISVNGQDMTIDYTELCNLADILGYLVMFTASIISLRIIGGAF